MANDKVPLKSIICVYVHFVDFTLGLTCLQCKNVAQPRMCTRVTECQPGEVITSFSFIAYLTEVFEITKLIPLILRRTVTIMYKGVE